METSHLNSKLRLALWCLLVFVVSAGVALLLPPHGQPAYTPDSIYYLFASRAIAQGHGISIPDYELFDSHFVPYTMWPPMYPLLLASGVSPLLLQAILLGCVAIFCYLLLARLASTSALVATVLSLIIALVWPLLMEASYIWSGLFNLFWVFLSMCALATLVQYRDISSRRVVVFWFLAVLAVSCAVYTRYASLVFIPAIMLVLLRAPILKHQRWILIMATPVVVGLLITPLLLHNILNSGSLSGAVRPVSTLDAGTIIRIVISYVGWVFGVELWQRWIYVFCLLALPVVALAYIVEQRGMVRKTHSMPAEGDKWLAWMATMYAASYLVGISALRLWRDFDLTVRMLSPSIPFILLAIAAWGVVVWRGTHVSWQRLVLALPFTALLSLAAMASLQLGMQAHRNWQMSGSPEWRMNGQYVYSNLYRIHIPNCSGIVLSARPRLMSFRTGWEFRRIPRGPWSHAMLMRIASAATALLINSKQAEQLAEVLHGLVPNPRVLQMGRQQLLVWGPPQKALGE